MSVLKRKDGGWRADICIRRGKATVRIKKALKGARNRGEALAMERDLRRQLEMRSDPAAKAPAFAAFADDFLEKYSRANNKPSEYESKKTILNQHLVPWFSDVPLDELGDEDIEAYKAAKLELELKAKTINNHLAVLGKMLRLAVEWKRIGAVPRVKLLKLPPQEFDFLSFEEAEALVKHSADVAPMVQLALNTGMRMGELLGLRCGDVTGERIIVRQAMVRGKATSPKSHKPREIPINKRALSALMAQLALDGDRAAPVFTNNIGGYRTKGACKWPLWSACRRAGLRRIGWHVLRHTFASHLAMLGVPIKTIQELLGHSDIRMTMRYAHLSPVAKEEAVAKLDDVASAAANRTVNHMAASHGPITDREAAE